MSVRLKDIAEAAGVSISTVSRILNGDTSHRSSDETARKVLETARSLGYLDSFRSRLQSLGDGSPALPARSIGCVLTSDHESFVSPFFSTLLSGIQHALARLSGSMKYRLFVTNIRDKEFGHFLDTTALDCGIMLGRTSLENISLLRERIPNLVYAGVNSIGFDLDEVICDGYLGARCGIRHLVDLGHRNIGFIGSTLQRYQVFNEHRYQGFLDEMAAAGLAVNGEWVLDTPLTSAAGYESMTSLLGLGRLPTAVFCGNDSVALGVMKALHEAGIAIPEGISVMGFDDIEMASYARPTLSTIAVPARELGRLAVTIMLDRLESGRTYPVRVNLPFALMKRESCRALPAE